MKEHFSVADIDTSYTYRKKYRENDKIRNETRKLLGHVPSEGVTFNKNDEFQNTLKFVVKNLEEVSITVKNK